MDDCSNTSADETAACPKGGRREVRREERREAILDVAEHSFFEHGYAGTTMSAIASRLGGSKGTLWSYFPSKELLFEAVLDRATRLFRAEMAVTLNPEGKLSEAIGKFAERFITKTTSDEAIALQRLVVGEAGRFPEVGRIYFERGPGPSLELLSRFLAGAMERGALRQEDPLLAAQNLVALCNAPWQQRRLTGIAGQPSAAVIAGDARTVARLFLGAYAP